MTRQSLHIYLFLLLHAAPCKAWAQVSDRDEVPIPSLYDSTEVSPREIDDNYYFTDRSLVREPEPYRARSIAAEKMNRIREHDAYWYANVEFEKARETQNKGSYIPLGQRQWFKTLVWVLIVGCFLAFLVIYLSGSGIGLFRRRDVEAVQPGEEFTENIFELDFREAIHTAEKEGEFRRAVRLRYLQLLRNLSQSGLIVFSEEKTNFDYLLQLHGSRYYEHFFRVTRHYEFGWYGQFEVSERMYDAIRGDFFKMEKMLPA